MQFPSLGAGAGTRAAAATFALLFSLTACQDTPPEPTAVDGGTTARGALARTQNIAEVAADEMPTQLAVAQAVPGFGGYYIDAQGRPTVWLVDPARKAEAAQALAGFLDSFGWTAADLQVRQADYDWLQLEAWYREARPQALSVTGAVFGDVDEASNRLTFAGLDAGALGSIASVLSSVGVPSAAVNLKIRGPVQQVATLRDQFRPPFGGVQINFFVSPVSPVGYVCTLGFNAIDGADTSFVTNSHCTNKQGGVDAPTDYYQAVRGGLVVNNQNYIAREVEDPEYTMGSLAGPCPIGRFCRYSDASRAKYAPGQAFQLGKLARAANENPTGPTLADTLGLDPVNPTFSITAEQSRSVVGQKLSHVGRTSGWTSGLVTETCVDINITASEITQLCQDLVDAYVAGGDSGSPVFGQHTDGTVFLGGILWGSSTNLETGHVQFIMTPLAQVKAEIGDVKTFDPPTDGGGKKPKKNAR